MKQFVLCCLIMCSYFTGLFGQSSTGKIQILCKFVSEDSTEIENVTAVLQTPEGRILQTMGTFGFHIRQQGKYSIIIQATGYFDLVQAIQVYSDTSLVFTMKEDVLMQQNVVVKAIQVREKTGFVYSKLNARQLSVNNLGQDFTYLIGNTPSALTTSDAGAGIGYTGIRIRGSDATRINVTINGIPINDAESHGVFWVNMPDLASSTSYVQIQRGVGSSTVGSGAFGANINIQNTELSSQPFLQIQQSYGSFNTHRSTLQFGTGRMGALNFSGRLSRIISDGYIDRSSSNLQSFQFNMSVKKNKWDIHALSFGGKEKTYQSWYGTPESRVNSDLQGMNDYADRNGLSDVDRANLLNSGRTYNYYTYKNQTDNYWQNHYQLHAVRELKPSLFLKASAFATEGKGYYEEFKNAASFFDYGVTNYIQNGDTLTSTDLVRQRWLDNWYYGGFLTANLKKKKYELIAGVNATRYDGQHYGEVVWAAIAEPFGKDHRYYESTSRKSEFNTFLKLNYKCNKHLQIDAELQYRNIHYKASGTDNDKTSIAFDTVYRFFNPKIGLVYELGKGHRLYGSYSIGQREPVRSDFIDNSSNARPKPEYLGDLELGYIWKNKQTNAQFNVYNMQYKNQLVLTGALNDVGSTLRTNVDKSYRRGIECILQHSLSKKLSVDANLNLSQNKILNFEDVYYDYDNGTTVKEQIRSTNIAFSPSVIAFVGLSDMHIKNLDLHVNCKYIGKQYLDNTLNKSAQLPSYYTLNFACNKTFDLKAHGRIVLKAMLNNLTGIFYSNNGYTYKYVYSGKMTRENFYYPQSGMNFMLGLDFKFL